MSLLTTQPLRCMPSAKSTQGLSSLVATEGAWPPPAPEQPGSTEQGKAEAVWHRTDTGSVSAEVPVFTKQANSTPLVQKGAR